MAIVAKSAQIATGMTEGIVVAVVFAEALFDVEVRSGPKTPTKTTATHIDTIERPAQICVDSHQARDDRVSPVALASTGTVLTFQAPSLWLAGCGDQRTERAVVRKLRGALNRRLRRMRVFDADAGASRSRGWPNAVHDWQLGACVPPRHPRARRSERAGKPHRQRFVTQRRAPRMLVTDAFSPSSASKGPGSRYPFRPVTRSGQPLKKPP
jgi:hypothetical protein